MRTLVMAGKVGPAFAKYASDERMRAKRRMFALDIEHARVVINIDRGMFFRYEPRRTVGMYYLGTTTFSLRGLPDKVKSARQEALHQAIYAAMPVTATHPPIR